MDIAIESPVVLIAYVVELEDDQAERVVAVADLKPHLDVGNVKLIIGSFVLGSPARPDLAGTPPERACVRILAFENIGLADVIYE